MIEAFQQRSWMHFFVDEKPEPFMFYFQVEALFNSSSSSA